MPSRSPIYKRSVEFVEHYDPNKLESRIHIIPTQEDIERIARNQFHSVSATYK